MTEPYDYTQLIDKPVRVETPSELDLVEETLQYLAAGQAWGPYPEAIICHPSRLKDLDRVKGLDVTHLGTCPPETLYFVSKEQAERLIEGDREWSNTHGTSI